MEKQNTPVKYIKTVFKCGLVNVHHFPVPLFSPYSSSLLLSDYQQAKTLPTGWAHFSQWLPAPVFSAFFMSCYDQTVRAFPCGSEKQTQQVTNSL